VPELPTQHQQPLVKDSSSFGLETANIGLPKMSSILGPPFKAPPPEVGTLLSMPSQESELQGAQEGVDASDANGHVLWGTLLSTRGGSGHGTWQGAACDGSPQIMHSWPTGTPPDREGEAPGEGAKRMEAARKAAAEIKATLEKKEREPEQPVASNQKQANPVNMGVVIHWSGIRGFGILRSQTQGEVFVHAKSLGNCSELVVGDVVTFEMGFDRKKQKPEASHPMLQKRPEAVNCFKAGVGGYQAPAVIAGQGSSVPPLVGDTHPGTVEQGTVDDGVIASAASAAALKLLTRGLEPTGSSPEPRGEAKARQGSGSRSNSASVSHSVSGSRSRGRRHVRRRSLRRSSRSRPRKRARVLERRHRR